MKHVTVIFLSILSYSMTFAQDVAKGQVPEKIRDAFTREFKTDKASWSKEEEGYEASFKKNGKEISVVFDSDAKLIETETEIQKTDLPPFVVDYISKNYANFKIKELAKIEANKGTFFEVEIAKSNEVYELIFDNKALIEKKEVEKD